MLVQAMWGGACYVMRIGSRGRGLWVLEALCHRFCQLKVLLGPGPGSGPALGPGPEPDPGLESYFEPGPVPWPELVSGA